MWSSPPALKRRTHSTGYLPEAGYTERIGPRSARFDELRRRLGRQVGGPQTGKAEDGGIVAGFDNGEQPVITVMTMVSEARGDLTYVKW